MTRRPASAVCIEHTKCFIVARTNDAPCFLDSRSPIACLRVGRRDVPAHPSSRSRSLQALAWGALPVGVIAFAAAGSSSVAAELVPAAAAVTDAIVLTSAWAVALHSNLCNVRRTRSIRARASLHPSVTIMLLDFRR